MAVIFGFVFVHGAVMQVRGPILPLLQSTFGVPESVLGLVGPIATAGATLAILIGGFQAGRLDMKRYLAGATVGAAVVTTVLSYSPTIGVLLVFFGLQGATIGLFRAFDRPILGHMYPESRSRMFSYYTAIWAAGAAAGPFVTTIVVEDRSWRVLLLLFVPVFLGFTMVIHLLAEPPTISVERSLDRDALGQFIKRPAVLITICLVVLSGSIEGVIYTWFPYFAQTFTSPATANSLLSLYFLAYIPGRFLSGTVLDHVDNLRFLLLLALLALPALYFTVVVTSHVSLGITLSGLIVSGLFPALLAFGVNRTPQFSGPINSLATGASFSGVTLSPAIVGVIATEYGIAFAMGTVLVLVSMLIFGTIVSILLLTDASNLGAPRN